MRPRFLMTLFALLAAAGASPLTSRANSGTPANSYTVVQVAAAGTTGRDMNDAGHVVGSTLVGGHEHAFIWVNGTLTDLGTLGGDQSGAEAVNHLNQVVGWAYTADGVARAFLRSPGSTMQDLGTLGGLWSRAEGINGAGQIVGCAADPDGTGRATLWQGGQAYDLGTPAGSFSSAFGISDSGEIVGYYWDANDALRAFRWTPSVPNGTTGSMIPLHPGPGSAAYAVNSAGQAVGEATNLDGSSWATLWDASGAQTIPPLPWSFGSSALGINASGTTVGYDFLDDGAGGGVTRAWSWEPAFGTRHLDLLTNTNFPVLDSAVAVNASGQIVANGYGAVYLLSPSGIPSRPASINAAPEATRVTLTWSPSAGAENYTIQRATAGGAYTPLGSVAGTLFTDTAVTSGATYSYTVTATNAYGGSAASPPVTVTIPPLPPTALTATAARGKRKVDLKWRQSTSPGVTQNRIYRSTVSGGYALRATVSATTAFADTSVSSGVTYYYVVTAVTSSGRSSAFSNQASATAR